MKTKLFTMLAVLLLTVSVSLANEGVGDITVDGRNTNTNTNTANSNSAANSDAKGGAATVYNNNNTKFLGQLPQAYPMVPVPPSAPMAAGEYGHQATEYSLEMSILYTPSMDRAGYAFAISNVNKGRHDWEEVRSHIGVDWFLTSSVPGGLPPNKSVQYVTAANFRGFAERYRDLGMNLVVMGSVDINADYEKGDIVKPDHIRLRAQEIAMENGYEVVLLVDQFTKGYLVPDGTNWFIDGLFSVIGKCFNLGGGLGGGVNVQNSKNTKAVLPGAKFVFLRLEPCPTPPPVVVAPPPPVEVKKIIPVCNPEEIRMQIRIHLEGCAHCPEPCLNNAMHRSGSGMGYIDLWKCTGDTDYLILAIEEFDAGIRDWQHGTEKDGTPTWKLAGARKVLFDIIYAKSFCIRILSGEASQLEYANSNGLKAAPDKYEELNKIPR